MLGVLPNLQNTDAYIQALIGLRFSIFSIRRPMKKEAAAETARVTTKSVIAVDRLTVTVTLNMTYVNFISLIQLSIREILYPVMSANTLNCFKNRFDINDTVHSNL